MTAGSSSSSEAPAVASAASKPRSSEALIDIRGLGICYRRHTQRDLTLRQYITGIFRRRRPALFWALRDVDLRCHEGEAVGIVGHNGAGKSTLCLVLSQILTADEGDVQIRARVSPLLSLGAGFNRELSGRQNIGLYAAFLGIPRRRIAELTGEIIDYSELGDFIDEPIRYYSSGMKSRLSFSVATALDPEILILDEVLSAGDKDFRKKSRDRIKQMIDQSKLIVLVSHSPPTLRDICTKCLWLEDGRVVDYGDADKILDAYQDSRRGQSLRPLKGSAPGRNSIAEAGAPSGEPRGPAEPAERRVSTDAAD